MNRQRELIYSQRDQVLDGVDLTETVNKMLDTNIEETVTNYFTGDSKADWNVDGLREKYKDWNIATDDDFKDVESLTIADTVELLQDRGHKILEEKEKVLGYDMFQDFERMVILRNVDTYWMDHIDAMEDLKQGIHLRSYAQKDPVVIFSKDDAYTYAYP